MADRLRPHRLARFAASIMKALLIVGFIVIALAVIGLIYWLATTSFTTKR